MPYSLITLRSILPSENSADKVCDLIFFLRMTGIPASSRIITKPRFKTDLGLAASRRLPSEAMRSLSSGKCVSGKIYQSGSSAELNSALVD